MFDLLSLLHAYVVKLLYRYTYKFCSRYFQINSFNYIFVVTHYLMLAKDARQLYTMSICCWRTKELVISDYLGKAGKKNKKGVVTI